ncbi:MAG: hypothetical protein ACQETI_07885 [Halobacteriota archaeon]
MPLIEINLGRKARRADATTDTESQSDEPGEPSAADSTRRGRRLVRIGLVLGALAAAVAVGMRVARRRRTPREFTSIELEEESATADR